MSKETAVISLGIWVFILPFLGFPEAWRVALFVLTGAGLVVLGFFMRAEVIAGGGAKQKNQPFVENGHWTGMREGTAPTYEHQEHHG